MKAAPESDGLKALHIKRRALDSPAEPLSLWDVGNTIALLMNRQVAQVAEQNHVGVGRLAIHADAADGVIVHRGRVLRVADG